MAVADKEVDDGDGLEESSQTVGLLSGTDKARHLDTMLDGPMDFPPCLAAGIAINIGEHDQRPKCKRMPEGVSNSYCCLYR